MVCEVITGNKKHCGRKRIDQGRPCGMVFTLVSLYSTEITCYRLWFLKYKLTPVNPRPHGRPWWILYDLVTLSRDRLIFNMGIPILGKDSLYIEMGSWEAPLCTPPLCCCQVWSCPCWLSPIPSSPRPTWLFTHYRRWDSRSCYWQETTRRQPRPSLNR